MTKRELVAHHRDAILALAKRHGATDIRLFGSVARGQESENSDLDFIVKLSPDRGAFDLVDLLDGLERLLGCKVDLLTEHRWMRARLRDNILRDAVSI